MNPSFFAIFPVLLCVLVNAAPAVNTPIQVTLRIEGATSTIFEGPITTSGHNVSTPSAGSHECDGLNQSANSQSGATAIAALSDGASVHGFGFDGSVFHVVPAGLYSNGGAAPSGSSLMSSTISF